MTTTAHSPKIDALGGISYSLRDDQTGYDVGFMPLSVARKIYRHELLVPIAELVKADELQAQAAGSAPTLADRFNAMIAGVDFDSEVANMSYDENHLEACHELGDDYVTLRF